jgi:hypothetical protein
MESRFNFDGYVTNSNFDIFTTCRIFNTFPSFSFRLSDAGELSKKGKATQGAMTEREAYWNRRRPRLLDHTLRPRTPRLYLHRFTNMQVD